MYICHNVSKIEYSKCEIDIFLYKKIEKLKNK
jgi:hypothetical protein